MTLETDLTTFWKSYEPVLELLENVSETSHQGILLDAFQGLLSELVFPDSWKLFLFEEDEWYDQLLVSKFEIPHSKGLIDFKPTYSSLNPQRQPVSNNNLLYDASIIFNPKILPDWRRDETSHLNDYRINTSSFGLLEATLENGNATFFPSSSRSNFFTLQLEPASVYNVQNQDESFLSELYKGCSSIGTLELRMHELGNGALDAFLNHLEITT